MGAFMVSPEGTERNLTIGGCIWTALLQGQFETGPVPGLRPASAPEPGRFAIWPDRLGKSLAAAPFPKAGKGNQNSLLVAVSTYLALRIIPLMKLPAAPMD